MTIDQKYRNNVSTQEYSKKPTIEGVELIERPFFADDGGHFSEILRMTESGLAEGVSVPFQVRQISMSCVMPGAIKAFHLHYNQDDLWYVPPTEQLLVNLHDVREGSPTFDVHMRLTLGVGKSMLLRIPAGVAHGAANLYHRPMTLCYATSAQFIAQAPDERRLPWDAFGAQVWELTKG